MICERCHKQLAALKYTEVVGGKAVIRHICRACLAELQEGVTGGFEVTGAPTAKLRRGRRRDKEPAFAKRDCPACGVTLRDVVREGRVGCVDCYASFGEALEPMIRSMHVTAQHHGKAPRSAGGRDRLGIELESKRTLLRTALNMENYEEAAELRDAIKTLEAKLQSSAAGRN